MHTFFLLLWGTCTLASIIGAITIIVLHDRHLRQDMKLRDEGIYITRVPRREALIGLLTPIFPAGFFALYLYTQVAVSYTHLGSRICPIGAIDSVVYSESKDEDTASRMWFLTKSRARINPLNPNYDEYYLLLMTRFRVEYGRWPYLDIPADVDKVNQLDNRAEVIPYFKFRKKISGLAEIDM